MEPADPRSRKQDDRENNVRGFVKAYKEAAPYLVLGGQLALTAILMFLIGWWADLQLGTGPWLMVVGTLLGATAGMINFFRAIIGLGSKRDRRQEKT